MKTTDNEHSNLWIFGYGSLMWDGWEKTYECTGRVIADLPCYRRIFNKASIERWGTKAAPGPTLNLVTAPHESCRGMAFKFPAPNGLAVRAYLEKREGPAFPLREHTIHISPIKQIQALVPMYEGDNLVNVINVDETAGMVCRAAGSSGRCMDYVKGIAAKLAELNIHDPAVTDLLAAIERKQHAV
jgi:cation transport protein ChaC